MAQAQPIQALLGTLLGSIGLVSIFTTGVLATTPASAMGDPGITALILLPAPEAHVPAKPGIDLSRLPVPQPEALRKSLAALLNQPVKPATLQMIRQAIIAHYKDAGHPFVDVGFPPQDVTDGTLTVIVTEFRVGTVKPQGNTWFSDSFLLNAAGLRSGDIIDKQRLDRNITQLNANAFLKVTPEFKPGQQPGTTNVMVVAQDRFPVDLSVAYANNGNPSTGWDRWSLGIAWGDALHRGQTLSYQLSTSSSVWHGLEHDMLRTEDPTFVGNTVAWAIPLPWGDTVQLSGGYQRQVPQTGPDIGSVGITDLLGALYQIPITENQQLAIGIDYKRSNNQISFGGVTVQTSFSEIEEMSLHYSFSHIASFGQTLVENDLYLSPGGLTSGNRDATFQGSDSAHGGTPGAKARFAYNKLTLTQVMPLPHEFGLVLRATGQQSTGDLLPSEQLSIAGIDTVRGYQEFGIAGSRGVLFSVELRGPVFHAGLPDDSLQPHLFFDQGQAWNPTASTSSPAYVHTASAGVGGRYQVGRYFSLRVEQGWQLIRSSQQSANGAFLHIAATATW